MLDRTGLGRGSMHVVMCCFPRAFSYVVHPFLNYLCIFVQDFAVCFVIGYRE